ncbi:MAG: hypothetical protein Q4C20_11635 [Erysipelotrichaceae bacterium]|nr:hypothetical protein [Erysipelotrichaceae bacterium]
MNWLVPCNPEKYDIYSAVRKSPIIYWRQRVSFEIGDTLYIYLSRGVSEIRYKAVVTDINIDSRTINDEFWNDPKEVNKVSKKAEIKIVETIQSQALSFKELKNYGLKSTIQGPMKLNGELLDYIQIIEKADSFWRKRK